MKLSDWAKKRGISYKTAWRWFKAGKIEGSKQEATGTILVEEERVDLSDAEKKLDEIWKILKRKEK